MNNHAIGTPTPGITALLRHARLMALREFEHKPAPVGVICEFTRRVVLKQVAAGLWRDHGVREPAELANLEVAVARGNALVGEPAYRFEWDFSRTKLPALVVQTDSASRPS